MNPAALRAISDPPSLQDELNDKAFTTMDWLVQGFEHGKLTERDFSIGVDTLFSTVAGLVDKDFLRVVTEAQEMCADRYVVKRLFHSPDAPEILSFNWTPGEDTVTIVKKESGMAVSGKVKEFETSKEARDFMEKTALTMEKRGWLEL